MERMPVLKGTLDVLVLKALSERALHGFEVTSWLEERSGGALELEDAAVYQALYRLEARALVAGEWGITANNRRARYYGITRPGRAHLRAEVRRLTRYAATLTAVLESGSAT